MSSTYLKCLMPCSTHPPSQEFASGFSNTEEPRARDTSAYMARRDVFTSGLEMERSEQISRKEAMRETANRISLNKRVSSLG